VCVADLHAWFIQAAARCWRAARRSALRLARRSRYAAALHAWRQAACVSRQPPQLAPSFRRQVLLVFMFRFSLSHLTGRKLGAASLGQHAGCQVSHCFQIRLDSCEHEARVLGGAGGAGCLPLPAAPDRPASRMRGEPLRRRRRQHGRHTTTCPRQTPPPRLGSSRLHLARASQNHEITQSPSSSAGGGWPPSGRHCCWRSQAKSACALD